MNILKIDKKIIERIYIWTMIIVPIIMLIYVSIFGQIPDEPDSYYWLSFSEYPNVIIANISILLMWISIFILFSFVKNPKHSPYFIASLFLLNFLSMRFFMIELKDFLYYLTSFAILIWIKNGEFKIRNFKIDARYVGLAMAFVYIALHNFNLNSFVAIGDIHTESRPSITAFFNILPILYILSIRNIKWMFLILLLSFVFMTEKFTSTGLTPLIFAFYMEFLTTKEFSIKGTFSWFFLIFFVLNLIGYTISHTQDNIDAFDRLCDPSTKICNAVQIEDYKYGHYFSWLGYRTHNPVEFGVCRCIGEGCFEPYKLICGTKQIVT